MAFLTRQEKYVIVFLIIGAVCGISYSYYKKTHPPMNVNFKEPLCNGDVLQKELDHLLKEAKSVNINLGTIEDLIRLKGIGPVLAHRIIEYRLQHGPFNAKEEIKRVSGIGPEKFDAIKDYIVIE
jgi:competence ComEA-like helix-hairpin-helix protein